MSSNYATILSTIAAVFMALSFVPQAIQTIKSKNTTGISLAMYILYISGLSLWILYGLLQASLVIILGNLAIMIFALPILAIKIQSVRNVLRKGKND